MSSVVMSLSAPAKSRAASWRRFPLVGVGTVVAAVIANVLVYFIGSALVGYDPRFVVLATVSGTVIFTLVPAIVAVLLYAALRRFSGNPARVFTIIAAVVLVVSVIPDFAYIPTVPGATGGQTAILVLMHAVAAGVIVWMLTTFARPQSRLPIGRSWTWTPLNDHLVSRRFDVTGAPWRSRSRPSGWPN